MTFEVLNPGLFSTIQDLGRYGHQSEGFSQAGSVDYLSHSLANQLLGNEINAPAVEMTFQGVSLKVLKDTVIATAGSDAVLKINDESYDSGCAVHVFKDDEISIGKCSGGARIYLAVSGGFKVQEVLGSSATHTRSGIGGFKGRTLKAGDVLRILEGNGDIPGKTVKSTVDENSHVIRVIPGQQFERFTEESRTDLFKKDFEVTKDSDRMGMRLSGPALESTSGYDVLSEPTQLGSIQVPKNGQPIILLNDRQTAGGYARIGTVALCDIPKVAQLVPGSSISFEEVTVEEAAEEYKKILEKIETGKYLEQSNQFNHVRRVSAQKILNLMG